VRPVLKLGLLVLLAAAPSRPAVAGMYPTDEKVPFAVRPDGTAQELSYGLEQPGQFNFLISRLAEVGKPTGEPGPKRKEVLDRIAQLRTKPSLTPAETAGLAADLFRTRQVDAALNLLTPRTRDRVPDFRILATLAHLYAIRGDWVEAVRLHDSALLDADFPTDLFGATSDQRKWVLKVEREYYRKWLQIRQQETAKRLAPEAEDVLPLFPLKFVNEAGVYEPGKLAAAERAKLPPDAVAVVQQMILWSPDDPRMHWLLGELYAANGRLREAEKILDDCTWDRQYTNRKVLMEHRAAVKRAVAALPKPAEAVDVPTASIPDRPEKRDETVEELGVSRDKLVLGVGLFAAVVAVMLVFQFRAIRRRFAGTGRQPERRDR
jgi:hypothetical protein